MKKREKWLCRLVCLTVLATFPIGAGQADAAKKADITDDKKANVPVVVDSRDLTYNNTSGDILASGDVNITQGTMSITADAIRGNSKTHVIETDGTMRIVDPTQKMDLYGTQVTYNYQERTGTLNNAKGRVQQEFVSGSQIEMQPDKTIIEHATTTKCPAKHPCWHVEAHNAQILPDGTVVADDATFFFRNKALYHTSHYENDPNEDKQLYIPSPGYNSSDGFYIEQDLEFPIFTKGLSAILDWGYYSKHDFRAIGGLQYRWNGQAVRILTGDFQDSDDEWIKKKIEYQWEMFNRRIGNSKFHYRFDVSHGLWKGAGKQSWHDEYNVYLSHDPIALTKTLTLDLGVGYQIIQESYDDSTMNSLIYDAVLTNEFSKKFKVWTGYHYIEEGERLFRYEEPDLEKEWRSGFRYSWNKKDAIGMQIRYDISDGSLFEKLYFIEKDLHCWKAKISYRDRSCDDKFKISFSTNIW